jgi:serine/threonine protein kinase
VEGPSEKLIDNGPANKGNKELCLEDFKIKKVLDKGSFGKVFLVVNTQDGEEYAMKRINKNVLIEKGQIINTRTEKDILI